MGERVYLTRENLLEIEEYVGKTDQRLSKLRKLLDAEVNNNRSMTQKLGILLESLQTNSQAGQKIDSGEQLSDHPTEKMNRGPSKSSEVKTSKKRESLKLLQM